jgi:hypothetical protein
MTPEAAGRPCHDDRLSLITSTAEETSLSIKFDKPTVFIRSGMICSHEYLDFKPINQSSKSGMRVETSKTRTNEH